MGNVKEKRCALEGSTLKLALNVRVDEGGDAGELHSK